MIKAVFFDLYHTLIRYEPPREEVLAATLKRSGLVVTASDLRRPIIAGDEFFYRENAHRGMSARSEEEWRAFWARYEEFVLTEAGITPTPELVKAALADIKKTNFTQVLFDDVLESFDDLDARGLALGLISNVDRDITDLLDRVGLSKRLKVCLTSRDVGATKPEPKIFREAVRRAGVLAAETLYVGDQYQIDVQGARGAGLQALLLDRGGYASEVPAREKINSLRELTVRL
jgi:putative hydrolase of the HAD superfamily